MIVHPKRKPIQQVNVPLTSLIDMVFLLLIYFLLTANFLIEETIGVKLPRAESGAPQMEEVVTINVDNSGRITLSEQELDIDLLFRRLQETLTNQPQKVVVIKADRTVELEKAVKVLDIAKLAGAEHLSLATEKEY